VINISYFLVTIRNVKLNTLPNENATFRNLVPSKLNVRIKHFRHQVLTLVGKKKIDIVITSLKFIIVNDILKFFLLLKSCC
jgi:hypothetical protein